MNETPPPFSKIEANQYKWLTPELFLEYAVAKRIDMKCKECGHPGPHWIDTGSESGMIPQSSAYSFTAQGQVNMGDTLHVAVTRVFCNNCGNIRQFAVFHLEIWYNSRTTADLFGGAVNGSL